ncbi:MAG: tRNA (adenosine(37)-N6)-threonylcarbamoyltransferase complex transferase subunit TsaD [Chloroflexota bacterium]
MNILAIESSCDETSAAVVQEGKALSNIIASQYFHSKYGGVVPELASRAHIKAISSIVDESLKKAETDMSQIDAVAVTNEPGLIGSLIVGSNFAKGLALRYSLPLIPVNHIEGHIFSGFLREAKIEFPIVTLVVSGGHTAIFHVKSYNDYDIMGLTRDDAAGEAFDKIAKLLGLTYPGGPLIDKYAREGNPKRYDFPRSMINSGDLDFSFSGLKTSVRYFLNKNFPNGAPPEELPDICASTQGAIVDVLVKKTLDAAELAGSKTIVIAGGVSANSGLRNQMAEKAAARGIATIAPDMAYCMDNAAMIGYIAEKKLEEAGPEAFRDLSFRVNATALRSRKRK